jgi:prepilin peptidase CpaA
MSELLVPVLVLAAGGAATIIDVRERRVPNVLTMGLASAGLLLAMGGWGELTLGSALTGLALGLAVMLPGHVLGATGAGDVKLVAAFGTLLGPDDILGAFIRMAFAGGALALMVAMARGRLRDSVTGTALLVTTRGQAAGAIKDPSVNNRFPYAPAIAIGAALMVFGW